MAFRWRADEGPTLNAGLEACNFPERPDLGRGGGTLIFSYIRRLSSFFWFNFLNFNIFGGFQKNKYFFGNEDFVDILGVIKNWTIFRDRFYAF